MSGSKKRAIYIYNKRFYIPRKSYVALWMHYSRWVNPEERRALPTANCGVHPPPQTSARARINGDGAPVATGSFCTASGVAAAWPHARMQTSAPGIWLNAGVHATQQVVPSLDLHTEAGSVRKLLQLPTIYK